MVEPEEPGPPSDIPGVEKASEAVGRAMEMAQNAANRAEQAMEKVMDRLGDMLGNGPGEEVLEAADPEMVMQATDAAVQMLPEVLR